MAVNASVPASYRGDDAQVPPSHKKDEAKIIFIGSVVFTAYRALTAPFRWVWNNTVYRVIKFFNLAGRVQPSHKNDLARFREAISQRMEAASRTAPPKADNAGRLEGLALPSSSKKSEYVRLKDDDYEALRKSLDQLGENAAQILYAKKVEKVLGYLPHISGLDASVLTQGLSSRDLALNEPVLHLLLNRKSPTVEEQISMQQSLVSVYQFLTKDVNWQELEKNFSAKNQKYFNIVKDWLCDKIKEPVPFEQYAKNSNPKIDLRELAKIYADVTKALLIEKSRVFSVQKVPAFGNNLSKNLKDTLTKAAPKVVDHLVLQVVELLRKAPMSQIIDDAVDTFHAFLNASLAADKDDFVIEFLFALNQRGIHCDPKTAIEGVTQDWVREHICMPFRDLIFSSHDGDEEVSVKAIGSFLSRIVDEIKLPDEIREFADFGLNLIKSYKPGSFCITRFLTYCDPFVNLIGKGSFFQEMKAKLKEQFPGTLKAAKLFVLEVIVDWVLAALITPRIHEAFNPRKVEKFLAKKLLPEATDSLMTAFIETIAASLPHEVFAEGLDREVQLDRAAPLIYEKLQSVCSIGRSSYLLNRYSQANCRELLRQYLAKEHTTNRANFTDEELLPYQNLLNTIIMDAAKISDQGNWLMNFGCKTVMPTLINTILAPNVLQAFEGYRKDSRKLIQDLAQQINKKALARDLARPDAEEGPSSASSVPVEDTLLYSMMMNDEEEVDGPEPGLDEFRSDFVQECDLLASIVYDMSSYQASKITGGSIGVKALLGKDQTELVRIIKSVADPILKRPLVVELLISRVATQALSSLQNV